MQTRILGVTSALNRVLRVGVLGMGAIGHLVAAQFVEKSGVQLFCLTRRPLIEFRFLSVNGRRIEQKLQSITEPRLIALDWLFICLKTYHYADAEAWLEKVIGPDTNIVVLRNGLDLSEPLLPYAAADKILPCLVDAPTQFDDATRCFTQQGPARLIVPNHPLALRLQTLLEASDITIDLSTDFKSASWEKLIESASLGAITCLTGQTCQVLQRPDLRALYKQALKEGVQVAKADGARIRDSYVGDILEKLKTYPPQKGSSMLTDRLAGRPIEVMAKSGIISHKAKELGVSAPLHSSFTALLYGINNEN